METIIRTTAKAMPGMAAARGRHHAVAGAYRWSHANSCVTGVVVFIDTTKLPTTRLSEASP